MGIERLARHPGGNGDRITTVGDLKLLSDRRRRGPILGHDSHRRYERGASDGRGLHTDVAR